MKLPTLSLVDMTRKISNLANFFYIDFSLKVLVQEKLGKVHMYRRPEGNDFACKANLST
jgi:hypothetical protein